MHSHRRTRKQGSRDEPDVTLVLAVREQVERIHRALKQASAFCARSGLRVEVVVVDDASRDGTSQAAARWTEHFDALTVLRHESARGLGAAARTGVLVANGKHVLVVDPEFPIPIDELHELLDALAAGCDVAVASRKLSDSNIQRRPPFLWRVGEGLLGWIARRVVRPGVRDTFAGAHGFLRGVGRAIAERAMSNGPGYVAEWIAIASRLGLHVTECPVSWSCPVRRSKPLAMLSTLREFATAGKRLKGAEYLAPLPMRDALSKTKIVRAPDAVRRAAAARGLVR